VAAEAGGAKVALAPASARVADATVASRRLRAFLGMPKGTYNPLEE
jgi:hypothetical protein